MKEAVKNAVKTEMILTMLSSRGGFDDWWSNIEEETQDEIKMEIMTILMNDK